MSIRSITVQYIGNVLFLPKLERDVKLVVERDYGTAGPDKRYVQERTCECVVEYMNSPIDGKTIVLYRCSKCNELMRQNMNYCPNCGRKVVSE